ncbi:ABC transporter ATP-binding protein [Phyllobacterium sp.]|nr:ABC transporter ATP-binding protein [Phyllobacterium sp.]
MSAPPLLEVRNLHIDMRSGQERLNVVENVSFSIGAGETFGLVGESGCGKSITALSLIGLLNRPLAVGQGEILFKGQNLLKMNGSELRRLRGNRISMIFQEPMTALNPLATVGRQIAEMFVLHQGSTWHEAERKAIAALAQVQVPAPDKRIKNYPHQMSGGMRQRVMIAIALACHPDLLIADEPTTALDVTVQAEILKLMQELCDQRGTSVLMISHDLGVIAKMCQRVGIMYAGHLVEERAVADLFRHPAHPYTHGLLASLPVLGQRKLNERKPLQEIEGIVPSIAAFPTGCRFEPRCKRASPICRDAVPGPSVLGDHSFVRCYHHG